MSREKSSQDSIREATRNRAKFSGHGHAKGAAGVRQKGMDPELRKLRGETLERLIKVPKEGDPVIRVGLSWENVVYIRAEGLINRLMKKVAGTGVDLDLGCLYELQDGRRGAVQAFGEIFGHFDKAPYITLSGDERNGNTADDDEFLQINAQNWDKIKRVLIYSYIYEGPQIWQQIQPKVSFRVPGEKPVEITLRSFEEDVPICALVSLENKDGQIKLTKHAEYFRGHPGMDRAFGFGLRWEEGEKD